MRNKTPSSMRQLFEVKILSDVLLAQPIFRMTCKRFESTCINRIQNKQKSFFINTISKDEYICLLSAKVQHFFVMWEG